MMMPKPSRILGVFLLSATLFISMNAISAAQSSYPNRPIRIVVPFAAGGPIDVAARMITEPLSQNLGQSVFVENRSGGGGAIGTELVAFAEPDGYTLLFGAPGSLVVIPNARSVRYDTAKNLTAIAQVFSSAQMFVSHPRLEAKTFGEFIDYVKANPGKINIGSAGHGTLPHLSIELMKRELGVNVAHVPFRGTGAAVNDLLAGQIDALFADVAVVMPNVLSKRIAALAVTSDKRSSAAPDVRTMAESGYPQLEIEGWGGLLAPAGLPPEILARLDAAVQKVLVDPKFRERAAKQGWTLDFETSPEKFRKFLANESARWGQLIKDAKIRLD